MVVETPWMTLEEAAAYIRRSTKYTSQLVKDSRLVAKTSGGDLFFRSEWLDDYMEALPDA